MVGQVSAQAATVGIQQNKNVAISDEIEEQISTMTDEEAAAYLEKIGLGEAAEGLKQSTGYGSNNAADNFEVDEYITEEWMESTNMDDALIVCDKLREMGISNKELMNYFTSSINNETENNIFADLFTLDDPTIADSAVKQSAADDVNKKLKELEKMIEGTEEYAEIEASVNNLLAETSPKVTVEGQEVPAQGTVQYSDHTATYDLDENGNGTIECTFNDGGTMTQTVENGVVVVAVIDGVTFDYSGTETVITTADGTVIDPNAADEIIQQGAKDLGYSLTTEGDITTVVREDGTSYTLNNKTGDVNEYSADGELTKSYNVMDEETGSVSVEIDDGSLVPIESFVSDESIAMADEFLEENADLLFDDETIALMEKMQSGEELTDAEMEKLYTAVCEAVYGVYEYVPDSGEDYQTFEESMNELLTTGKISGDCEDPDIFVANLLYAMGFSSEEVNIYVDAGTTTDPGHSVIGLTLNGETQAYDFTNGYNGDIDDLEGFDQTFYYNNEGVEGTTEDYLLEDDGLKTAADSTTDTSKAAVDAQKEIEDKIDDLMEEYVGGIDLNDDGDFDATIENLSSTITGLYNVMLEMANYMCEDSEIFDSPGALFLVQTKLQMIKDAIAAITAIGKAVGDTVSEAVKTFSSNVGRL